MAVKPQSALRAAVGGPTRHSGWRQVTQALVDDFARVTGDHAFIHTDPGRAAATRFRGTIAHGLLTLSLLTTLLHEAIGHVPGVRMGVNYGFDRIRFIQPVPVGSRIRAAFALIGMEERDAGFFLFTYDVTVEIEGSKRPALAANWLIGRWLE
jgi:acyl dehydratase